MTRRRSNLSERLAAIEARLPPPSVRYDLTHLTPIQARRYRRWQADTAAWAAHHTDPAERYAAHLDGLGAPELPIDLETILGADQRPILPVRITRAHTVADAAEIYRARLESIQCSKI